MLFDSGFGLPEDKVLDITLHSMKDVTDSSEMIQNFCRNNGLSSKVSYEVALFLEEMAGNVIAHGFFKWF